MSDIREKLAVPAEKLRRNCDPAAAVVGEDIPDVIGQEAAMDALRLGLEMVEGDYAKSHYNIAVVGKANTGRTSKTVEFVRQFAARIDAAPPDVVCVHNFDSPRRPLVLILPNGMAQKFSSYLELMRIKCLTLIPEAVSQTREKMTEQLPARAEKIWEELRKKLATVGFLWVEHQTGYGLAKASYADPTQPMSDEEFTALPHDKKREIEDGLQKKAEEMANEATRKFRQLKRSMERAAEEAGEKIANEMLGEDVDAIRKHVAKTPEIDRFLNGLMPFLKKFALEGLKQAQQSPLAMLGSEGAAEAMMDQIEKFHRFTTANILVDNKGVGRPPVIHVKVPQYTKLFGRVNYQHAKDGAVTTDHTMVEAGEFLKANGGYLVLDLLDLLRYGGGAAFFKMMSVIRTRKMVIEGKAEFLDINLWSDYRTEETPLDVKVVVVCERWLMHALSHFEPEFENLFRIVAEFDDEMDFGLAPAAYAAFVELCRKDGGIPEFTPEAVAKLVEYGARRAGDNRKASTEFGVIKDVVTEAAHWAASDGSAKVEARHVAKAIDERLKRRSLVFKRYLRFQQENKLLTDSDGEKVGQINGLVVYRYSEEITFGAPSRITARAYAGADRVVLVQRKVNTSGPSSNTAVEVIGGYISGEYGLKKALSLTVQLCFEQCYGGVDGDSASLAETIATISAITGLPVDQRLAITGSMNQWGEAQPIGGTNYKIEGHFGFLKSREALGPGHGVVVPVSNLDDLMLDEEVVEAQRKGLYQVYAVKHIDEALEIFLGKPIEEIRKLVEAKLAEMPDKDADKFKAVTVTTTTTTTALPEPADK